MNQRDSLFGVQTHREGLQGMIRHRILSPLCAGLLLASAAGCGGDEQDRQDTQLPPSLEPMSGMSAGVAAQAATAGVDAFGVTMIYPTRAGGEAWSLQADATKDPRFKPQDTITRNADGSWKMKSTKVRMSVFTSTGYNQSQISTYDRDDLTRRGYMQAPNDWKNVEMTGFVKINAASDWGDDFSWYARGGRHNDSAPCEGSSYKGGLGYDGRVRFQKESWHVSYDSGPWRPGTSSLKGRWVGFKAIQRNTTVNGKPAVRLEIWLNENADRVTWKQVYDLTDSGQLGGDQGKCGSSDNAMPLTWGGPIAVFRWDNATDVDFKWLSVRELDPLP